MKPIILLFALCLPVSASQAQQKALNIAGIWQLVGESRSENKLQVTARNKQALNSTAEEGNKTMLAKLKNTYRTIQQRYRTLGTAINAANIGLQALPMVSRIISNQAELYELARNNPALIALAYQSELAFADKALMLIRYLAGLCISIGDVNQMKTSDRSILFDYLLSELSNLQDLSNNLLKAYRYTTLAGLIRSLSPFPDYISTDREMALDIITNARYLVH